MDTNGYEVHDVDEAFGRFALHIIEVIEPGGWDQPAALWGVYLADVDDESHDRVALALNFCHITDLDGAPAAALAGMHAPRDVIAIAVSCEGWSYSPERTAAGEPDGPPSSFEDSLEMRLVHLVAKDGTEVLAQQFRTGEASREVSYGPQHGRLPEALRRVMGLPSHAPTPNLSVQSARSRVLPAVVRAGMFAMAPAGPEALDWALDEPESRSEVLTRAASERFGLTGESWDEAVSIAATASFGSDPAPYGEDVARLLGWADGPMWAAAVDEALPSRTDVVLSLEHLRMAGVLSEGQFHRAVRILDLAPS